VGLCGNAETGLKVLKLIRVSKVVKVMRIANFPKVIKMARIAGARIGADFANVLDLSEGY
jgi:hypothetical protein